MSCHAPPPGCLSIGAFAGGCFVHVEAAAFAEDSSTEKALAGAWGRSICRGAFRSVLPADLLSTPVTSRSAEGAGKATWTAALLAPACSHSVWIAAIDELAPAADPPKLDAGMLLLPDLLAGLAHRSCSVCLRGRPSLNASMGCSDDFPYASHALNARLTSASVLQTCRNHRANHIGAHT